MNKSDSPIFFTLLLITQTLLGILHDGVDCLVVCYQLCLCVEYYQLVARVTTNCTFCSVYLMSSLAGTAPIIHSTHAVILTCFSHILCKVLKFILGFIFSRDFQGLFAAFQDSSPFVHGSTTHRVQYSHSNF